MKKIFWLVLCSLSLSLAASSADAAFNELDCEFGECGSNPADPAVKEDPYKEPRQTQPVQDNYLPRYEPRAAPQYSNPYTPASPSAQSSYTYIGVALYMTSGTYNFTNTYIDSGIDFDASFDNSSTAKVVFGTYDTRTHTKFEMGMAVMSGQDAYHSGDYSNVANVMYDSTDFTFDMILDLSPNRNQLLSGSAFLRLGVSIGVTQSTNNIVYTYTDTYLQYYEWDSSFYTVGYRVGVGYSMMLGKTLELFVDYTFQGLIGTLDETYNTDYSVRFDYDVLGYYGQYGVGINLIF